jgi:tetratricopeptide (TPR) repeat protein
MTSKVPFVKQETNWFALIPKLAVIGILCLCFYPLDRNKFFILAFFVYLILTYTARHLFFPAVMHEGLKLIKEEKFEQAIPSVQKTIDYYTKKAWVDKFRFLLLISSSKKTIREMTICNLAYCYLQTGEIQKSKKIYSEVLRQYPENINAKSMLNTIDVILKDKLSN